MKRTLTFLLLASLFTAATGALAQGITDPIGNLLPTYIGPQNGDVDVASAFAGYDPASDTFSFSGTFADALGTTEGAFYLRGLDRGVGTEGFVSGSPSVGQRMKFDAAVFLRPDGMARVITFVGSVGTGVELGAGTGTIAGACAPQGASR